MSGLPKAGRRHGEKEVREMTETTGEQEQLFPEMGPSFREFIEASPSVMLLIDPETGAIVQANEEATAFYGYPKERLERMGISEINILPPEEILREMTAAKTNRKSFFRFRHRLASGELRAVHVYSSPVQMEEKRLLCSIIQDVTDLKSDEDRAERRRLEEHLARSVALLGAAIESVAEGIIVVDQKGRVLIYNANFERFWNTPSGWSTAFDPEERLTFLSNLARDQEEFMKLIQTVRNQPDLERSGTMHLADGRILEFESRPFRAEETILGRIWSIRDVTEREEARKALETSLREKELLLREIHHRVKNNLQIVASLLSLHLGTAENPKVREALMESRGRVQSMALIHEKIYRSRDVSAVNLEEYVADVVRSVAGAFGLPSRTVTLDIEAEPLPLDIDRAVPCGLVLNELVTNVYKHAFPQGQAGTLFVRIAADREGSAHITIADDGVGLPDGFDPKTLHSLGITIVAALVEQLRGTLRFSSGPSEKGTAVHIRFPLGDDRNGKTPVQTV
jgi:PAS domain S-box-containing protein